MHLELTEDFRIVTVARNPKPRRLLYAVAGSAWFGLVVSGFLSFAR